MRIIGTLILWSLPAMASCSTVDYALIARQLDQSHGPSKPRRIQHHRRAVTGGDVGVLGGGDAGIAAWNVYPPVLDSAAIGGWALSNRGKIKL
jgi:hypothetical protein